jgi:hypothetical protein
MPIKVRKLSIIEKKSDKFISMEHPSKWDLFAAAK